MTFFESRFEVRLTDDIENRIARIVLDNPHLFESKAHFVRCAINELVRKHEVAKNEHQGTARRVPTYVSTDPSFKRQNERLRPSV